MLSRLAGRALESRGKQEAREMKKILEGQRERIGRQRKKAKEEYRQLTFGFLKEEARQFEVSRLSAWSPSGWSTCGRASGKNGPCLECSIC